VKILKSMWILMLAMLLVAVTAAYAERAPLPRAKDYLTSKVLPEPILKRGEFPDSYMFPNDWVKQQNWEEIRKKYGGTKLVIMFEGTDIGAPLMTKNQFEKMSGMKLEIIGVPIQVQFEKTLISLSTGAAGFDIATLCTPYVPVLGRFLEPLEPYFDKYNYWPQWNDYIPQAHKLLKYKGKIVGFMNDFDNHFWHSRGVWLEKIGVNEPPRTWDQVLNYARKLKKILPEGMYPLGFMMSRDMFGWESYWDVASAFGANYFKPGTWEPAVDSPEAIKAANFMRMLLEEELLAPGSTTWDYARQLEAWNSGKLVMCYQYPIQESYRPDISVIANEPKRWHSLAPKGIGPKGRHAMHGTFTNVALGINKMSKHKDAAFIWGAFQTSKEVTYIYTIAGTGCDYWRKSIFENIYANKFYPNAKASVESMPYWYLPLQTAIAGELREVLIPAVHDVWTGKAKAEEILPKAADEWRAILEKYGYFGENGPKPWPSFWQYDYPEENKVPLELLKLYE